MVDIYKEENNNGVRFTWNVFPDNKLDHTRIVVPIAMHYSPFKKVDNLQVLEYDPILCKSCKAVIAPFWHIDFRSKAWECPFCNEKHVFPSNYANFISEANLPAELISDYTTIEYKLNKKETNHPIFLFVIDISIDEEELVELKETIQNSLSSLPPDCGVGIITYGKMCNVLDLSFSEFPKMYVFRGDKDYKPAEIQEQLGLIAKNDPRGMSNSRRFILPLKDCELFINSFLDDLTIDQFDKVVGERKANCGGLALHVAISLLESICNGEPSRIMFLSGNPANIGPGKIIGVKFAETIRNYVDFDKKHSNTDHFKPAVDYYDALSIRAFKAGQVLDVFSCSLNQTGLLEMKCLVEKTGGYMLLTDSFSTLLFKDSYKKLFELDEYGELKMAFKAKMDVYTTNPIKISGGLGHLVSLNQKSNMVSDVLVGQSGTKSWNLGGMDQNSTYTIVFDVDGTVNPNSNNSRRAIIQILTTYVAGDRSTRLRVTTCMRKITNNFSNTKYEVAQSFDQEASSVLMARLCVDKGYKEEFIDVLRWLDKNLIRLISKFAEYTKDDPKSFKLSKEFNYFPQFMFYLRRSHFIQNFNASPDEVTYYKISMMHENIMNCTIMIQPVLFVYTPEKPEATAVFLEVGNMKPDWVLLLDAFFFVCVWHGENVSKWRDEGIHLDPDYENIKQMLENPQEYAQSIMIERTPIPRFISCDSGTGQERLLKCILNPTAESNDVTERGYYNDDVSSKVFMDHLIKKAVQS
jgi:protein transport protein SEC23